MTIQTAASKAAGASRPFTLCIVADPAERARLAEAFDPADVVVMVPDREAALAVLTAGRPDEVTSPPTELGDLVVDREHASVTWTGRSIDLTHLEIEVLACLTQDPGRVWSYEDLHRSAWGSEYLGDRDSTHSLVKRLRRKLRDAGVTLDLHAVRGVGFRVAGSGTPAAARG